MQPRQVTDPNGGHYSGKKFFTAAVLPNTVIVSLIGKVGGTAAVDTGTPLVDCSAAIADCVSCDVSCCAIAIITPLPEED